MFVRASLVAIGLLALGLSSSATAAEKSGVEAKAAFARIKTLAGDWKVAETMPEHGAAHDGKIVYKVTANGSAVMETFFPGLDHEMISMYHLDGDELRLTHYCAAGNQPRMKLDREASNPEHLVFVFDGGTNLDPAKDLHIHSGEIKFLDGGKVEAVWDANMKGKKAMSSKFSLSRP